MYVSTRNNDKHLDDYVIFIKNDPSKKTESDDKLDSLQAPEDDLNSFGAFVKPQKEGLLRHAEALRKYRYNPMPARAN